MKNIRTNTLYKLYIVDVLLLFCKYTVLIIRFAKYHINTYIQCTYVVQYIVQFYMCMRLLKFGPYIINSCSMFNLQCRCFGPEL